MRALPGGAVGAIDAAHQFGGGGGDAGVDLGVPEFLLRDVLRGVLGQELLIVACGMCGGAGCAGCAGTGVGERRLRVELVGV